MTDLQELYSAADLDILKNYVKKHYGKSQSVYRDYSSSGVHLDIAVIPPKIGKPFYTLVTMGMGAHKMTVPDRLKKICGERTELILVLDKGWRLEEKSEEWYWPLHLMRDAARTLAEKNSCFGAFHLIDMNKYSQPLHKFCGAILAESEVDITDDMTPCVLTDGSRIKFLQFIPLFREELRYGRDHGGERLFDMLKENSLNLVYGLDSERHSVV